MNRESGSKAAGSTKKDLPFLQSLKRVRRISMLTCYDFPTARLEDQAGVDIVLVGDSVGTNVLGYKTERDTTMDDMLHHLRAVRRGIQRAFLLADMPHRSYDRLESALANARALLDGGADAVKLEGGGERADIVRHLTKSGVNVCGHIGFTPQTLRQEGRKARVQGRSFAEAQRLVEGALALSEAGAGLLVLELIPQEVARFITDVLQIPTIGIGAGPYCDGQVLVIHDVLGLTSLRFSFAKRYQRLGELSLDAIFRFIMEVQESVFPARTQCFSMEEGDLTKLTEWGRRCAARAGNRFGRVEEAVTPKQRTD